MGTSKKQWVPAFAGMTEEAVGMTEEAVEMTEEAVEMTEEACFSFPRSRVVMHTEYE